MLTETSFLKSHKQFVKRHLNRRSIKPVSSIYPCARRITSRNSREHFTGPKLTDNVITLDQLMIEVMDIIDGKMKGKGSKLRRPKSLKWIKGGWR